MSDRDWRLDRADSLYAAAAECERHAFAYQSAADLLNKLADSYCQQAMRDAPQVATPAPPGDER